jgi:hypothetical protein
MQGLALAHSSKVNYASAVLAATSKEIAVASSKLRFVLAKIQDFFIVLEMQPNSICPWVILEL